MAFQFFHCLFFFLIILDYGWGDQLVLTVLQWEGFTITVVDACRCRILTRFPPNHQLSFKEVDFLLFYNGEGHYFSASPPTLACDVVVNDNVELDDGGFYTYDWSGDLEPAVDADTEDRAKFYKAQYDRLAIETSRNKQHLHNANEMLELEKSKNGRLKNCDMAQQIHNLTNQLNTLRVEHNVTRKQLQQKSPKFKELDDAKRNLSNVVKEQEQQIKDMEVELDKAS